MRDSVGSGLFGNGLSGKEILRETRGVGVKELLDALRLRGLEHEAGVVIFRDAVDDFRILVGGGVRLFLASERDDDAGIVAARCGKLIGLLSCADRKSTRLNSSHSSISYAVFCLKK